MKTDNIQIYGNVGCYLNDGNTFTFQFGENPAASPLSPLSPISAAATVPGSSAAGQSPIAFSPMQPQFLGIQGYQVLARGYNNALCDEVTMEIKQNRLLPRLYSKQIKMLYGHGPVIYRQTIEDNKLKRQYTSIPEVEQWLNSWPSKGMQSVREFCLACIKNYYYFGDFFVKWRFARGPQYGALPVAGLEAMENRHCLLATNRTDAAYSLMSYEDFSFIAVGKWNYGYGYRGGEYKIYPKFSIREAHNLRYAAISHHREKSVAEFYGQNETHQGARPYIQGSNQTAHYINSFLRNSLAAKIHIIIPNAWVAAKRTQITRLCEENKTRLAKKMELVKYNGIEIGTEFTESLLVEYIRLELRKFATYLSGSENQGKAYSTYSFMDASGHEQSWKIETIDLKYKEYIESLVTYDKRTEAALLSSVGLDAAISAVDKDGVISKSGADSYYNYLIYIMSLTSEDELCAEPLNQALQLNFPDLFAQGYRIGFYREVPQRQEDVSPQDRLNRQQS